LYETSELEMENRMKIRNVFAAFVALAIAIGCGGGGGGSNTTGSNGSNGSTNGGGGTTNVRVFATDDLSTNYDHVWVTVKRVELTGPSGDRTLFDDADGIQIDLKTLRDTSGRRFRLLSNRAINSGRFTGLRVTVDKDLIVIASGTIQGTQATFNGAGAVDAVLSVDFPERNISTGTDLIVDFDLSVWELNGTVVSAPNNAFLKLVTDNSLGNLNRHSADDYKGTVSAVTGTAPNQTFTLTRGNFTVNVRTDANTAIYNENGTPSPVLSNGARVEVVGSFSTTAGALIAKTIKIDNDNQDETEIYGQVTLLSQQDGTIAVNVLRTEGFLPVTNQIVVQVNQNTQYFGRRGTRLLREDFFALAKINGYVEAEGSVSQGVLSATKVKLEDGGTNGDGDDRAEIRGTTSNVNSAAGTFRVAATQWEGIFLSAGQTVNIVTNGSTEFKINGENVESAQFFAGLTGSTAVKVEGDYDPNTNTLVARETRIGGND